MLFLDFSKVVLACYFTFVAMFYAAKLMAMKARTGISRSDLDQKSLVQNLAHTFFSVFRVTIWGICIVRVFDTRVDSWLIPIPFLYHSAVIGTGLVILALSLFLIIYVQNYLGMTWRSGVGPDGPSELVTNGPYGVIRHPIFVAAGLGQLGFFLALPSVFSLSCLSLGLCMLFIQGCYEEKKMHETFGQAWTLYKNHTHAFIPHLFKGKSALSLHIRPHKHFTGS
jgi:protein-S-isoprenylcysteine O-methyltransferase Ste14